MSDSIKFPSDCTNAEIWVALARMLNEQVSQACNEARINKCRATLLAYFLSSELDCKMPGCDHSHDRTTQVLIVIASLAKEFTDAMESQSEVIY